MWKKISRAIADSTPVSLAVEKSKHITLPGFEGVPLYDVITHFLTAITKGAIPMRASAVSFNFFLAIFPSVIFIFTLIPYIPIENFQERLLSLLKEIMPHNAYEATKETIFDIVTNQRGGLLSVGFISALYFSTNGFNSLITTFNATYHDMETRSPFQQRLVSIYLVIISTLLITIAIALMIFSEIALNIIFKKEQLVYYLVMLGRWIILFGLFYSMISFTYFLGPSKKSRRRFASPGSMLATVLSVLTSVAFTYYVNNFGQYNKLYGSIGTLIVILLWIYLNSLVILAGFDLNASIRQAKYSRKTDQ